MLSPEDSKFVEDLRKLYARPDYEPTPNSVRLLEITRKLSQALEKCVDQRNHQLIKRYEDLMSLKEMYPEIDELNKELSEILGGGG